MGFTTGFTGGVTLTLGLAYLSILSHQRNRQAQGDQLRLQAAILQSLIRRSELAATSNTTGILSSEGAAFDPRTDTILTRTELAARRRAGLVENLKDRWNEEVEGAVRWVQGTDWDGVRADAESGLSRVWGRLTGRTGADHAVEDVKGRIVDAGRAAVQKTQEVAAQTRDSVVDGSRKAADRASRTVVGAKDAVVATAGDAGNIAAQKKSEAKEETKGLLARGIEKGKQMVGLAQDAAGWVGEKVTKAADSSLPGAQSDVEKALHQRYERRDGDLSRSVSEVLQERYRPIDKRDNTVLRGI